MPRINEIKDQRAVVETVGDFAGSLQQIAAMRMVKLRQAVIDSRKFVDEATLILRELHVERLKEIQRNLEQETLKKKRTKKTHQPPSFKTAVIIISSDQGLCGSYNTEIFQKIDLTIKDYPLADYFVIGKKGQHYFESLKPKVNLRFFPYNLTESVSLEELRPLLGMFYYYDQIYLIYSHYLNTATRNVIFIDLAVPNVSDITVKIEKEEGKYLFEPSLDKLISQVTAKIRYALFRQQILDSKLSLYTAQMVAMKTASDNALDLLADLKMEYNKARRKLVDKKINEVQAGRSLWDTGT